MKFSCNLKITMFLYSNSLFYMFSIFLTILITLTIYTDADYATVSIAFTRATQYIVKVIDKTCLLKPSYGPCRANVDMYYFDPSRMNCSTFKWGGCQGNGNRFDSFAECQATCVSSPNVKKSRPKYCSLSFDYGFCFGAVYRYYYDPLWKVCKERIYSGCGGNLNNFYSLEQCESVCRFGTGFLTVGNQEGNKNKKKVLIINPWQHTRTTKTTTTNGTGPTTCMAQTEATSTIDPNACF